MREIDYTAKETATIIRAALKVTFPGVKFSVTSKNSINVKWADGPSDEKVSNLINHYSCRGFDGMTDSNTYNRVIEIIDGEKVSVRYSYSFIFSNRTISDDILTVACKEYCTKFGIDYEDNNQLIHQGQHYLMHIVSRDLRKQDIN